ncbi:hypothetical protein VU11_06060 [Desulfobulbus sp. US2]|nr:hypothetical protein [Desulfobulbus sp. US4]MCW5204989.1 hypothetical protein [Desulfobulbus sp. N2]MCW5208206.1 hypothetical protein [Desulfobulbus sp. US2]MCW5214779.1 hypothetical protein [Desulfobulbus sp. US5]WLE98747.1 MAG: hypothetical protein QTN59_07870 [Candidatus Electrothrix communis]
MAEKKKNLLVYHVFFILICGGLFYFLWSAPPETTPRMPRDKNHEQFMDMDRKQAEGFCLECHGAEKIKPLSEKHPQPYRCLFCHKRVDQIRQLETGE